MYEVYARAATESQVEKSIMFSTVHPDTIILVQVYLRHV